MVITLIGYRGSGKSSVAAPLAAALGWSWADADDAIEKKAGCSIREIFATDGEPRFRDLEAEVLSELLSRDRLIIAAGGGAIMRDETRRKMKSTGPVVWLKASVETLDARINGDATTAERRPNLTNQGGRQEIEDVLMEREPLYRDAATVTVETDGCTLEEIVACVLKAIPEATLGRNSQP